MIHHYKSESPTDQRSEAIAETWLKSVQERLNLWKQYHARISKTLSPTRGTQFLQPDHQMALFVDIAIASEMPVIGPAGK